MHPKKIICHVELKIGEKATEQQIQRLMEKGFDHCIYLMIQNEGEPLDLEIDSDYCMLE